MSEPSNTQVYPATVSSPDIEILSGLHSSPVPSHLRDSLGRACPAWRFSRLGEVAKYLSLLECGFRSASGRSSGEGCTS